MIETGWATPIAEATWASPRAARAAAPGALAGAPAAPGRPARPPATPPSPPPRAAYGAERSTFEGSLPENAPPPWRAMPPYVSPMIFRPGRPAAPLGPPVPDVPGGGQE